MTGRPGGDDGSISLELAIIAPMLLAIIVLMLCYGRQAQLNGMVEAAARDGARVATHARTYDEALTKVGTVVDDTLMGAPPSCRDSSGFSMGDRAAFMPGAMVTVQVWCNASYAELGLPLPTQRMTRVFSSRLDPYRGVR